MYKWLYRQSKSQLPTLIGLMVGNGIWAVTGVFFVLCSRALIDAATGQGAGGIKKYSVWLVGCVLLQLVLRIYVSSQTEKMKAKLTMQYRENVLGGMLHKAYPEVSSYHTGELMQFLFGDVQLISEGVTTILPGLINMVTRLIGAVVALVVLDRRFACIFLIGGSLLCVVTSVLRRAIKGLHKRVQEKEGSVRATFQEILSQLLVVKCFGSEEKVHHKAAVSQQALYKVQMQRKKLSILANTSVSFIFQIGYLYGVLWGVGGLATGTVTYGTLLAVLQLVGQLQGPLTQLSGILPRIYGVSASVERLLTLEAMTGDEDGTDTQLTGAFEGITFEGVDFGYATAPILECIDLVVKKGDFVALSGPSGSGKSTLLLLLLGIYKPKRGNVCFQTTTGGWVAGKGTRELCCYVPQRHALFSGTIRENITFMCGEARADVTAEVLDQVLEIVCAKSFVDKLPHGIETVISEGGLGLSEGQAQRLALARALLSKRPLLVLDEATSALDELTEWQVLKNIRALEEQTCLMITHRPAGMHLCNKHFHLEGGRVALKEGGGDCIWMNKK